MPRRRALRRRAAAPKQRISSMAQRYLVEAKSGAGTRTHHRTLKSAKARAARLAKTYGAAVVYDREKKKNVATVRAARKNPSKSVRRHHKSTATFKWSTAAAGSKREHRFPGERRRIKKLARKAHQSVGTRRKNSSSRRRAATKSLRGRMFVRMRPDAAGWQGMGLGHNADYDKKIKALAGKVVEVDTTHLFDDQYNLKDYPVRVFDKQIVEVINDVRRGKTRSGWSGEMKPSRGPRSSWNEPAAQAYAAESGFAVGKLYKPLRTHPGASQRKTGPWASLGTVVKIFKNKTVLTSKKVRLPGGGHKAIGFGESAHLGYPQVGAVVFRDPEGVVYYTDGTKADLRRAHDLRMGRRG